MSGVILAILGEPKMALPMPKTKNGDHFYRPNYPPKPRKNHLCNTFWPLESGILAILHILHILASFLECKRVIFFKLTQFSLKWANIF